MELLIKVNKALRGIKLYPYGEECKPYSVSEVLETLQFLFSKGYKEEDKEKVKQILEAFIRDLYEIPERIARERLEERINNG